MRLVIFGIGGFGRELVDPCLAIMDQGKPHFDPTIKSVVFADQNCATPEVLGLAVIHPDEIKAGDNFILAVGDSAARQRLDQKCREQGAQPYSLRAPTAVIGRQVSVGEGAVLCDFTMITASAQIGDQFQCNIYSYVAHDCIIGDFVTFAPRVCCNGNVHIGDHAYIGTGAVIKQGTPDKPLLIGKGAVVGMGAVVTKDVPEGAVVIGNPARTRE